MWCTNCNKISYSDVCDVCGGKTQEDTPIEVYWCDTCSIPLIFEASYDAQKKCPCCGKDLRYFSKDLRPVFPEERLLLEIIHGNLWLIKILPFGLLVAAIT